MSDCPHCGQTHADDVLFCPSTGKAISVSLVEPGAVIADKYRVVRRIASGGMGAIYEVEHAGFGKHFAMKLLLPELAQNMEVTQRFEREAKAASAIGHPNIIEITDVGQTDTGLRFIVMELLSGQDLGALLKEGAPLPQTQAVEMVSQILLALQAAHGAGIIHRDLKPENVFLHQSPTGGETVKLLDFGISKIAGTDEAKLRLTSTGLILGTPYYMSPEQAKGSKEVDLRADLYSVGVILYETLTGRRPYTAENLNSLIYQIIGGSFPPPSTLVTGLPPHLEAVTLKALSNEPDQRFADAASFRAALLGEQTVEPPPPPAPTGAGGAYDGFSPTIPQAETPVHLASSPDRDRPGRPRPRRLLLMGLLTLGLGAAALAAWLWGSDGSDQDAARSPTAGASMQDAPDARAPRDHGGSAVASKARRERPRRSARVRISVDTSPKNARLALDGQPVRKNPFFLPRGSGEHELRVSAPGHVSEILRVKADQNQRLVVSLRGAERPAHRRRGVRARRWPRRRRPVIRRPSPRRRARRAPPSRRPETMRHRIETTTDI